MLSSDQQLESIETYLRDVTSRFTAWPAASCEPIAPELIATRVFEVLTSRDFCYLSRARAAVYRDAVLTSISEAVSCNRPIPFFYDIGAGYHASIRPGKDDLLFDVGLAELLVLSQVADFAARVEEFYGGGVRFSLVIDNVCGKLVNDIPLGKTRQYCVALRQLIVNIGLERLVDVLVESEHVSAEDFRLQPELVGHSREVSALTPKQYENVSRFLGRACDEVEASERASRYQGILDASDRLLAPLIHGVHMTQRATNGTLCFRPFRGGDSRIQCGLVALTKNSKGKLCPMLLTTSNVDNYVLHHHRLPSLLPAPISHVTYAERIDDQVSVNSFSG